jgi:hypothetical protein
MASADGNWDLVVDSPMGTQQIALTLTTDGDSLSGAADTPFGHQTFDGGKVEGDHLSWKVALTKPMPMNVEFSADVDGDAMSGSAKLGMFGKATFSGTRQA